MALCVERINVVVANTPINTYRLIFSVSGSNRGTSVVAFLTAREPGHSRGREHNNFTNVCLHCNFTLEEDASQVLDTLGSFLKPLYRFS